MNGAEIIRLRKAIATGRRICVFTGAGISCPSGIPDFRSSSGLYNQPGLEGFSPEQIISHSFFTNRTKLFYDFYKSKMLYPDALPNAAHKYFASLENSGKPVAVVTQNIDGLHQAAGSSEVYELHGNVHRNKCMKCGKDWGLDRITGSDGVPVCDCGGIIKPDVVLYEEPLDEKVISKAISAISHADVLIVVGTSLTVYPAASFTGYFRGNTFAVVNMSETSADIRADIVIYGDAAEIAVSLNGGNIESL